MQSVAKFTSSNGKFDLVVEDNDKVGYAYLLENGNIVGDVWLYNRQAAPEKSEWDNPELIPFVNPVEYAIQDVSILPKTKEDIEVRWNLKNNPINVEIYLNGVKHALLSPGEKPGYSRLAKKDGPLAKQIK